MKNEGTRFCVWLPICIVIVILYICYNCNIVHLH